MTEGLTIAGVFEAFKPAVSAIFTLITDVVGYALGNPVILIGFAASMVGLAVGIFHTVKASV